MTISPASEPRRPAPVVTDDNAVYWEAAARHELVAQRCGSCGRLRHPPRPMCPDCHSLAVDVQQLRGTGSLYSYAILHYPQHPRFDYPILAALVDLDEGVRIMANLVDIAPDEIRIGMRLVADFVATRDEMAVPVFRREVGA